MRRSWSSECMYAQGLRKLATCILACLLVVESVYAQQPGASDAIQQQIATSPSQAHMVLHLSDGRIVRGRIISHSDQDFALKPDTGGRPQTIAYKQVAAVEHVHGHHSKAKWFVIGVAGAAVVVAVIAIHAVHSPKINGI